MRKQKIYMALVSVCGLAALGLSMARAMPLFADAAVLSSALLYSAVLVVLLVVCHMTPIYITADKTMEISFVPVVACLVTKGMYLAVSLYALSSLLVFLQDPVTHKYYSPWSRSPRTELYNVCNVLVGIYLGGLVYHAIEPANASVFTWSVVGAAVAFSCVAILSNLFFFLLYFRLSSQGRFFALLRDNIGGIIPNIVCTIPLGLLIGYMFTQPNGYLWIALFMGPLLLARYSFKIYLDSHTMLLRTIASLVQAIEAKDPYTHGHSQRVAYFSSELCRALGCSKRFTDHVKMAALLHDTGKIGVEDAILRKPGPLTEEEFDAIKQHPVVGRRILESIALPSTVTDAVLYHHRRYDGKGYPAEADSVDKLPLSAAILAVADCYDAIISDRPYRKSMTKQQARQILREVAGTQLDPKVVAAFLAIEPNLRPDEAEKLLLYTV